MRGTELSRSMVVCLRWTVALVVALAACGDDKPATTSSGSNCREGPDAPSCRKTSIGTSGGGTNCTCAVSHGAAGMTTSSCSAEGAGDVCCQKKDGACSCLLGMKSCEADESVVTTCTVDEIVRQCGR